MTVTFHFLTTSKADEFYKKIRATYRILMPYKILNAKDSKHDAKVTQRKNLRIRHFASTKSLPKTSKLFSVCLFLDSKAFSLLCLVFTTTNLLEIIKKLKVNLNKRPSKLWNSFRLTALQFSKQ